MAGSRSKLTAKFVQNIKEPGKYYDGCNGLFLQVYPTGAKCWQQRITIRGRRCTLGLGGARTVKLKAARKAALENCRLVEAGEDPLVRKRRGGVPTLEQAVAKVIEHRRHEWKSAAQERSWIQSFKRYVYPTLGRMLVSEIEARDVLAIVEPMWHTKPDAARKVRWRLGVVMKWAVAHGHRADNPAGDAISGALRPNYQTRQHYPAVPYQEVGGVIAAIYATDAWWANKLLFEFLVLTAVRSGEARGARWTEVSLDEGVWLVPATRMKAKSEHRVPLSCRAIAVLEEAHHLGGGDGLVFPSPRGRVLDSTVLTRLLRSVRADGVPHGFRSSFRDWCSETSVEWQVAESCLAHAVGNQTSRPYMRSELLALRHEVMEDWAEYLAQSAASPGSVFAVPRGTCVPHAKPGSHDRRRPKDAGPINVAQPGVATHERNDVGRDFIAGDIHGCYDTLERALELVRFESGKDRLFSAGDLVDRGPHSLDALKWLKERRIHDAALGNHEAMVLGTLVNRERRVLLGWMAGIDGALRERWIDALRRLPVAMSVATAHGPVGVVHAGVVDRSWTRTLEGLERRDKSVVSTALLGGYEAAWRGNFGTPVEGLRALVTGHEPSSEPGCDGQWWSIDTGAGVRGFERLTLLRIDCEPMQTHTVEVVASERLALPQGPEARQSKGT